MKKLIFFIIPIVIILLVTETAEFSADTSKDTIEITELQFDVYVKLVCDDNTTKTMIESHIKRELRSLGDVEIVDEDEAKYILNLITISHNTKIGNKTGQVSIAVMSISKSIPVNALIELALTKNTALPKKDVLAIVKKWESYPTLYDFPDLYYLIVNIKDNDLPKTCREIVAEFDIKGLEPMRKFYKKLTND